MSANSAFRSTSLIAVLALATRLTCILGVIVLCLGVSATANAATCTVSLSVTPDDNGGNDTINYSVDATWTSLFDQFVISYEVVAILENWDSSVPGWALSNDPVSTVVTPAQSTSPWTSGSVTSYLNARSDSISLHNSMWSTSTASRVEYKITARVTRVSDSVVVATATAVTVGPYHIISW